MAGYASGLETQANPWDVNSSTDQSQQAIAGFHTAVAQGIMSPEEGLTRLKKGGHVPPTTKVEDLSPPKGNSADHLRATPFDKLGDTNFQTGPMGSQRNLTNPAGSAINTPTMNQPGMPSGWVSGGNTGALNPTLMGMPQTVHLDEQKEEKDLSNQNKHVVTSQLFDPEQNKLRMLNAMGYDVPRAQDEWGTMESPSGKPQYDLSMAKANPMHPVQQQIAQVNRLQDLLKMQNETEAKAPLSNNINLAPLLNLASKQKVWGENEGSLLPGYQPPETGPQQSNRLLAGQQSLMKDRADIQKGIYENMRTSNPTMTLTDTLAQLSGLKNIEDSKDVINRQANQAQMQQDKYDNIAHNQLVSTVKRSPIIKNMVGGLFAMGNSQGILQGSELNKNSFAEAQNLSRIGAQTAANIRTTGDERTATYMTNLSNQIKGFLDNYVEGGNLKIDKNDPQVKHFINLNNELIQYAKSYRNQSVDFLTGGQGRIYHRGTPESDARFQDLMQLVGAAKSMGSNASNPGPRMAKSPRAAPKSTFKEGDIQEKNGVKYRRAADGGWDEVK